MYEIAYFMQKRFSILIGACTAKKHALKVSAANYNGKALAHYVM
jgi:hypothetical protein